MAKVENVESKKTKKEGKARESKTANFPAKAFVNKWGFIHLSKQVLSSFGLGKGNKTSIIIDMKDGNLIISKTSNN
jgi:hypothetical protein